MSLLLLLLERRRDANLLPPPESLLSLLTWDAEPSHRRRHLGGLPGLTDASDTTRSRAGGLGIPLHRCILYFSFSLSLCLSTLSAVILCCHLIFLTCRQARPFATARSDLAPSGAKLRTLSTSWPNIVHITAVTAGLDFAQRLATHCCLGRTSERAQYNTSCPTTSLALLPRLLLSKTSLVITFFFFFSLFFLLQQSCFRAPLDETILHSLVA